MKRSLVLAAAVFVFALALIFPTPYSVAKADPTEKCNKCVAKVQRDLDKCEAQAGGPTQQCYDEFNLGIVHCYATVCEQ